MKILQVDFEYDYGDKQRGFNQIGHFGILRSFESLGHEVRLFAYDDYLDRIEDLQKDLIAAARAWRPDLIFVSLFRDQFRVETLEELKKIARTVSWFGDDTWRFEGYSRHYARHFTDIITTDPLAVKKYHALGQQSVHLSQWAAIEVPEVDTTGPVEYARDVCFVGGANPSRRWMIHQLRRQGISVVCFGHGWDGGVVSTSEMAHLFRTSRINLNLSNSITHDIRYIFSSPRALREYLRSTKTAGQIKARNFEIPFFGGFQLTDYVPFIERYFRIGDEIACFASIDEAELLIRHYLENEQEREQIRAAGQDRAARHHTYRERLRAYLDFIRTKQSGA